MNIGYIKMLKHLGVEEMRLTAEARGKLLDELKSMSLFTKGEKSLKCYKLPSAYSKKDEYLTNEDYKIYEEDYFLISDVRIY